MAQARKLKVFRTPIGFHDAYVAAPSQKAALAAWGSDTNLFASGMAELVTDPALIAEPLARPGEVVKRLRASAQEQIAHASKSPPTKRPAKAGAKNRRDAQSKAKAKPRRKPPPRPDRSKLEAAEREVEQAQAALRAEEARIAEEIAALERERRAIRTRASREIEKLERARAKAEAVYERALAKWQAG